MNSDLSEENGNLADYVSLKRYFYGRKNIDSCLVTSYWPEKAKVQSR